MRTAQLCRLQILSPTYDGTHPCVPRRVIKWFIFPLILKIKCFSPSHRNYVGCRYYLKACFHRLNLNKKEFCRRKNCQKLFS